MTLNLIAAIKFARWQHPAIGRAAKSNVPVRCCWNTVAYLGFQLGAVGVEGVGCGGGGWAPPQKKKSFFVPKLITLKQFLTGISLGTRILRFSRETKLTKTVQKLSKNSWSDQGGGRTRTIAPPPWIRHCWNSLLRKCTCDSLKRTLSCRGGRSRTTLLYNATVVLGLRRRAQEH